VRPRHGDRFGGEIRVPRCRGKTSTKIRLEEQDIFPAYRIEHSHVEDGFPQKAQHLFDELGLL
jgi:hypothetical protein